MGVDTLISLLIYNPKLVLQPAFLLGTNFQNLILVTLGNGVTGDDSLTSTQTVFFWELPTVNQDINMTKYFMS